jgi:hypothetical protein
VVATDPAPVRAAHAMVESPSGERSTRAAPPVRHSPKILRSTSDAVKTLKVIEYSPVRTER